MSPHAVSGFVNDLVEMAKAMEEAPKLREKIETLTFENTTHLDTIMRLEVQAIDRKNEIDTLNSTIARLEVERDDAGFRQLEAEDRVAVAIREMGKVENVIFDMKSALGMFDVKPKVVENPFEGLQPKAVPSEPKPMEGFLGNPIPGTVPHPETTGQGEANPTSETGFGTSGIGSGQSEPLPTIQSESSGPSSSPLVADKREPDPTPTSEASTTSETVQVTTDPTGTQCGDSSIAEALPSPFVDATPSPSDASFGAVAEGSRDPDPTVTTGPSEPQNAQTGETQMVASGAAITSDASQTDPEPPVRWSSEWYDWRDRQRELSYSKGNFAPF